MPRRPRHPPGFGISLPDGFNPFPAQRVTKREGGTVTIRRNPTCRCGRPKLPGSRYCARCRELARLRRGRRDTRERPDATARGYGTEHRRLRKAWAARVDAGEVTCARCGRWIAPGSAWDLDHDDQDRSVYLGPSHAKCNRATSAHKAKRSQGAPAPRWSEEWFPRVPARRSKDW